MNITQSSSSNRATEKKAVIGGGWITAPAVAAHVRRHLADAEYRAPQQPAGGDRKALIGGGWITAPAVAAHMRQKMRTTTQR